MIGGVTARLALVVVAIATVGWLAMSYRSVQHTERAVQLAHLPPQARTPATVDAALREFERARRWNPDPFPLAEQGLLLASEGRVAEGVALLEQGVRREPENSLLWGLLARVTQTSDPARSREAAARLRELNPLAARP
jgi:hypothetical protein